MLFRKIGWLRIIFILLLYSVVAVLLPVSLSTVTARQELKEVRGRVSACDIVKGDNPGTGYNYRVEAQLAGYDRKLVFYNIEEKADAVYNGLPVGADVVLLVEERNTSKAIIWEGQSNGDVFLHYETVAQWHKSNKRWGLGFGLALLLISSGAATWRIVAATRGSMV